MAENRISKPCVVIGGSAGSLKIILDILSNLRRGFTIPVIIVLHRKSDSESALTEVISNCTRLKVKEAEDKEPILQGMVYLAPANYHLLIEKEHIFSLDMSEKVNYSRPSIDVTFQTAAEAYGSGLIGIILSGANNDGTAGLRVIRENKGTLIAQDPKTAYVPIMPQSAIDHGLADYILPANGIADFLNHLA
jgi:two-component system, chemotaxis family, protein-glutamate methylesterase/glutaminase